MNRRRNSPKARYLEDHGYFYVFRRKMFVNLDTKVAFSIEAIEDHDFNWLVKRVHQPASRDWVFHFNRQPPQELRDDLIASLQRRS